MKFFNSNADAEGKRIKRMADKVGGIGELCRLQKEYNALKNEDLIPKMIVIDGKFYYISDVDDASKR